MRKRFKETAKDREFMSSIDRSYKKSTFMGGTVKSEKKDARRSALQSHSVKGRSHYSGKTYNH